MTIVRLEKTWIFPKATPTTFTTAGLHKKIRR